MEIIHPPRSRQPVPTIRWAHEGCALLVWEWPDGVWCYLDQLWMLPYRLKGPGKVAPWYPVNIGH